MSSYRESRTRNTVQLSIQAPDFATELLVIDSAYQLIMGGRDWGLLKLDVEPGLYKLKFRLGTTVEEVLHEVPSGEALHEVRAPALKLFTPAPLDRAAGVQAEHQEAAYRHSREVHASIGRGSQLFVFAHTRRDGQGRSPASGLALCAVDGRELLSFADVGEASAGAETPWAACNVQLDPGAYVLRTSLGRRTVSQVVVTSQGLQTSVFLGPSTPGLHDAAGAAGLDPANAAILVGPPGFNPRNGDHLMTEASRVCLSEGRPVPWKRMLWERVYDDPMLLLFRSYSLLHQGQPPELLQHLMDRLRNELGQGHHPDFAALALALGRDHAPVTIPPMMQLGWSHVVRESHRRKDLIPADSLADQAGRSLWGSGVWLAWSEEHRIHESLLPFSGPAEFTPLESVALQLAPRRRAAPSALPRWAEERQPVDQLSSEAVARALQVPTSVAEETLEGLRSKLDGARRQRALLRRQRLATPGTSLCTVIIPEGVKLDPAGLPPIDFEALYAEAIEPAILDAGLVPIRLAPELLHLHERLLWLSRHLMVELTTREVSEARVLGTIAPLLVRPAILPLRARHHRPPVDSFALPEPLEYELGPTHQFTEERARALRAALSQRLRENHEAMRDAEESHHELSKPRQQLVRAEATAARLAEARADRDEGRSLRGIEEEVRDAEALWPALHVDLFLSYRTFNAWDDMVRVADVMPPALRELTLVQTQLAFALNRRSEGQLLTEDRRRAINLLAQHIDTFGPAPEPCGILGRIYKDLWEESSRADRHDDAREYLDRAIDSYTRGFESDWREPYPGINAVTLLELRGDSASLVRKEQLLPVVRFAVEQRLRGSHPGYWEYATMLELAVLEGRRDLAWRLLYSVRACVRERFELEITAHNLSMIARARERRQEPVDWVIQLGRELTG